MGRSSRRRRAAGSATLVLLAVLAGACSGGDGDPPGDREGPATTAPTTTAVERDPDAPLPAVLPTPRQMAWHGPDVAVAGRALVAVAPEVDEPTRALVAQVLEDAGAEDVQVTEAPDTSEAEGTPEAEGGDAEGGDDDAATGGAEGRGPADVVVRLGGPEDEGVAAVLGDAGLAVPSPLPAEGYALATADGAVAIAASDPAGWFYGAQTLRQLVVDGGGSDGARRAVAGVGIVDHPAMPWRGVIEGFYGSPWTEQERLDQLAFYGRVKLNTYVYAPKDDPYHRERWREPYPADQLAALRRLVEAATANHVTFTFAVSPGTSACYSDPADAEALLAKLGALHDLGARSFSIALDDIVADRWNCPGDATFGPPSMEAAARAQVTLVNRVQRDLIAARPGTRPLSMVPTEYRGTDDSPYRSALRTGLDPAVDVMWTGQLVVPAEVTVAQAQAAGAVFGRPPLLWDNTPVNDFPPTEGRLILAPYARREPGLGGALAGVLLNPMNQAAASKVALVGAADFTWNDGAYDPARAHRAAATLLAADGADGAAEPATVEALLAFFDVENLAPTSASDGRLSQPQAPALAGHLDAFRTAWSGGDRAGAVAGLRPYADVLAGAPAAIRAGAAADFVADAGPWLDALELWGGALVATLDALDARAAGDEATAATRFAEADALVGQAGTIHTIAGETRPQGPVRVADGVLDVFLAEARGL